MAAVDIEQSESEAFPDRVQDQQSDESALRGRWGVSVHTESPPKTSVSVCQFVPAESRFTPRDKLPLSLSSAGWMYRRHAVHPCFYTQYIWWYVYMDIFHTRKINGDL